jgi:hypothetical protein
VLVDADDDDLEDDDFSSLSFLLEYELALLFNASAKEYALLIPGISDLAAPLIAAPIPEIDPVTVFFAASAKAEA